ncbi:MAG: hypothetical protein NZO58_02365 [Gemmataceae bacterium]|nr:hypothetical protein [Gemmataceae bacterium]
MAATQDIWYVRLPSGRVIRSRNSVSLRYHVRRGRIPATSQVRRSFDEDWVPLAAIQEFAEAAEVAAMRRRRLENGGDGAPRRRSHVDYQEWRTLGVRGLVRELADALDSSLHRAKLGAACFLGILGSVALVLWRLLDAVLDDIVWRTAAVCLGAGLFVVAASTGISLITQFTAVELSRMRSPRRPELWPGALGHGLRLSVALLLIVGSGAVLVWLLRHLPGWVEQHRLEESAWWGYAAAAALVVRLILEVVFWPLVALAPLLLSPILVIQECSVRRAIREWWRLLRTQLGRIFLYEALATTLAAVFTVPLLIPIALAWWSLGTMTGLQLEASQATLTVLTGIAMTPFLATLLVANVFIYLNLRYEFFHSAR